MATTSVDYSDFLLVFKALQLKENEPNGMICLCGLEKEDTAFSKDNEDIRKINRLVSSLGLRGSFRDDSFQIETIMVPARSDYPSSTKGEKLFSNEKIKLQKIFRAMSPYKRLVWCGRLLIEFHEENQCCRYLSSALKFYVKAIENVNSARLYNSLPVDMKIQELLRLSTKFRVHQSVFLELLRLLSTPGYYRRSVRTIDDVSLLEDIFRATNDRKIDIFVLWKKFDSRSYHSFYCFIYEKIETFTPLIKFGKTECISIESGGYLMESWSGWADYTAVNSDYRYNSTAFRALQTLCLFYRAISKPFKFKILLEKTIRPYSLKLLWNSITEPFLCEEEFKKSVTAFGKCGLCILNTAWKWYVSHVLENVISPKGPRSLAHLSRCSVRRQLAACFRLPCGVEHLDFPRNLKDYILLEH